MENEIFNKKDINRCFNSEDIGKIFWRVESYGTLTQCLIYELKEKGEAVIKLAGLTDLKNEEYKIKKEVLYWASSTYGTEVLRRNDNYYYNFDEAKKASIERWIKEVNPNGKYRLARYFDDIFECYVTDILTKKDARTECNRLNSGQRAYVSYGLKSIA